MQAKTQNSLKDFLRSEVFELTKMEKVHLSWMVGVFLFAFLLFFQPFGVNNYDPNETITWELIIGLSAFSIITSLLLFINEILIRPLLIKYNSRLNNILWISWSIIWLGSGLYLTYNFMGNWHDLSWKSYFLFVANVSSLAILPVIATSTYGWIRSLQTTILNIRPKGNSSQNEEIIKIADSNEKEHISLKLKNLRFIESEDNYVTVNYIENGSHSKKLLRQSLRNLESQNLHRSLVRCHRSYIVNLSCIEKVEGNKNKMQVNLPDLSQAIPIARSYMNHFLAQLKQ